MSEEKKVTEMPAPAQAPIAPRRNPKCKDCGADPITIARRHVRLMPAPGTPGEPQGMPGLLNIVAFCGDCGAIIQLLPIMHIMPADTVPVGTTPPHSEQGGETPRVGLASADVMPHLPPPPKKKPR